MEGAARLLLLATLVVTVTSYPARTRCSQQQRVSYVDAIAGMTQLATRLLAQTEENTRFAASEDNNGVRISGFTSVMNLNKARDSQQSKASPAQNPDEDASKAISSKTSWWSANEQDRDSTTQKTPTVVTATTPSEEIQNTTPADHIDFEDIESSTDGSSAATSSTTRARKGGIHNFYSYLVSRRGENTATSVAEATESDETLVTTTQQSIYDLSQDSGSTTQNTPTDGEIKATDDNLSSLEVVPY